MELPQVLEALKAADAAGNVEDARKLALLARDMMSQTPAKQTPAKSSTVSDLGYSALSGLGSLVQFPGQVYGLATGNMDNSVSNIGQSIQNYARANQSEGLKQKQQAQHEAIQAASKDGFLSEAGTAASTTLKDPILLGNFIAENIANLLPGLGASRGVMAVGMRKLSTEVAKQGLEGAAKDAAINAGRAALLKRAEGAAVGLGVAQQGAQVGGQAYEDVYKKLIEQQVPPEEAAQKALSLARGAGASGAVISYLTSRLPGARSLEKAFAGTPGTTGRLLGVAKGVLGEGISEGLEEGGGQIMQNAAVANVDPNQNIMQGVGQSVGQAGVLGGVMGGAGGYHTAGIGAQVKIAADMRARQEQAQQLKVQQEQEAAAQQAKLQDPAYAAQVAQEYQAAEAQFAQLKAAAKVGKDASMADKLQAKQAQEQVKAFENDVLKPKAEAYLQVKPVLDAQQTQAPAATLGAGLFPDMQVPSAPEMTMAATTAAGRKIESAPVTPQAPANIPTPEDVTAQHAQYRRQIAGLEDALENQRHNVAIAAQTGETEIAAQEAQKFRKIEAALEQARKEAAELPPAPKAGPTDDALNKQYATAQTALRKAGEIGDVDAVEKLSKKIDALRQQNPGLFTKDSVQATAAVDQQTADEMAEGVAPARERRERVVAEEAALRRIASEKPRYAGEARQERQTQLEVEGMERAALPYGTTEQRPLFPQADPVQYTSAATTQRRGDTREGLVLQVKEMVKQLDSLRLQRGTGRAQQELRGKIRDKIDDIRDFDSAVVRQDVPRGTGTVGVSPGMPERTDAVVRAEIDQALKERRTNPAKLKRLLAEWRGQRAYAALAGSRKPVSGRLPASQNIPDTERTLTPTATTGAMLRKAVASAPQVGPSQRLMPDGRIVTIGARLPKLDPLVARIRDNLGALETATEGIETALPPSKNSTVLSRAADDVARYLHQLKIGQDTTDTAARVRAHLDRLEQGKRSDTEQGWSAFGPREVSQGDMFHDTELQGVIFDTPEEFQKFLASDALNESRKAVGLALQTSARAYKTIAPLEAKAAELRESIGILQTMLAATRGVGAERIGAAMASHDKAVERIEAQEKALDVKLQPLQAAYTKAQLALSKAADTLAGVLNSIAKNTAKFNSDIDLQTLAAETAQAQEAHAAMLRRAANGGKVSSEESTKLYNACVAAINAHRSGLEQYLKTGNKIQERSILAFLNRDMDFMLRLRDAEQSVERANEGLNSARAQLDAAAAINKEIRNSVDYLAEQRVNKRSEAHARGVLTRVRGTVARNIGRVRTELQARYDERKALDTEITEIRDALAAVKRVRAANKWGAPLIKTQSRDPERKTPVWQTPAQIETAQRADADAQNRIAEQAKAERLQAIPGTAVSFEQARKTTEYIAKLQDRAKELEARSKDETASKSMRNKDKYEAANIRKEIAIAFGTLSNETEMSTAAKQALAEHLAELDTKIGEKKAAILEPGKAKKTILERRKDLTDLRSKKRELVRLQEQAQQRSKKTEILTPEQRAEEARDDANRLTLERGIDASTGKSSGVLPLRKTGPLVKPVLGGKITQGGRVPKMRANEQALAELSKIETLLEQAQAKLEEAQENNDAEAIEKYTGFVARLEKARPVAERALEKSSRTARAVNGGEGPKAAPSQANRADRTSTDMSPELAEAVTDGRILDAVDALTKMGYPVSRLRSLVMRTKISVDPNIRDNEGNEVAGMYYPKTNSIVMRPDAYAEDVYHELIHAATDSVLLADPATLTPVQREVRKELEGLQRMMVNNPAFAGDVIPNVREFVAEAMTNPEFRERMNRLGKPMTLWQRFLNSLRKLVGLPPKTPVDNVEDMIDKIMMSSRRMQGAGTPSAQRTTGSAKDVVDRIVAKDKPWWGKIKDNLSGLAFETQMVDRFAGFERLSRVMEPLKGSQMMYYLRMYDQRQHYLSVAASNGVPQRVEKTRADGKKEYLIESVKGANLKNIADTLAKAPIADKDYVTRLFTGYMAAIRAKSKGIETLNFGGDITQADLDAIAQEVQNTPGLKDIFEDARRQYNEYNRDLIKLLEQSGAISKDVGAKLVKEDDYIPYYRDRNGVAELLIGSESPIRVGNIKEQPHLQELVGGDRPILDFTTSAVQNTSMILDMALNNIATKNAAFELQDMGMADIGNGHDVKGNTIVKFYDNGAEKFARVDTSDSIPADLLVKGMAGIPTQLSGVVRLLAMPAQLLRKAVTISPVYAARQVFRDSLGAALGSGANIVPVYSAVKEINAKNKEILNNRGITGGQVFTGTSEDMSMVLRDVTAGKPGWLNALGKLEAMSMGADALTRRAQYGSYIKQGMSEMEATLQTLESMNFSKRGASPSIHMANAMIPFLNAQIQSLNVLYKSFTGNMPHNERLNIKGKLIARGTLMAAASLAYAAAMEDDEAYKNALPEQKYGNWFVRVPGVEEAIRVPVPFELGYIFKSVPEALYRSMTDKHGSDEAVKAFSSILRNTIPGGSSYGLPQAIKPLIEAGTGKSLFTGRDILSRSEQGMEKPFQFRENTTQIAREAGQITGQSPIMLEQLLNGYTGGVGMFVLSAIDSLMPTNDSPEKAARRLSSRPMIGGVFQPNDAGGIINDTYEKMGEFTAFKKTVDGLLQKGERAQAMQLLQERSKEYAGATVAGAFTQKMGQLSKAETAIRASDRSPEEKRRMLDNIRQYKIQTATAFRDVYGKVKGD